jgi:hypothetical protein
LYYTNQTFFKRQSFICVCVSKVRVYRHNANDKTAVELTVPHMEHKHNTKLQHRPGRHISMFRACTVQAAHLTRVPQDARAPANLTPTSQQRYHSKIWRHGPGSAGQEGRQGNPRATTGKVTSRQGAAARCSHASLARRDRRSKLAGETHLQ